MLQGTALPLSCVEVNYFAAEKYNDVQNVCVIVQGGPGSLAV